MQLPIHGIYSSRILRQQRVLGRGDEREPPRYPKSRHGCKEYSRRKTKSDKDEYRMVSGPFLLELRFFVPFGRVGLTRKLT